MIPPNIDFSLITAVLNPNQIFLFYKSQRSYHLKDLLSKFERLYTNFSGFMQKLKTSHI